MYKVFYNLIPANILSHFTHISNVYSTRQRKNLYVHYARTRHKQMCVEHMGVIIWNSIEIETRNCKDLRLFKVKYKKTFEDIPVSFSLHRLNCILDHCSYVHGLALLLLC